MIHELVFLLLRAFYRVEIAASAACLLVLAIRGPARRLVGSALAYRLWSLPLAAGVVSLFPSLAEMRNGTAAAEMAMSAFDFDSGLRLLAVWLIGVAVCVIGIAIAELAFRRRAVQGRAGPAIVGLGWRRLVVPSDFRTRFSAVERDLILRHERAHIARRDPEANLLIVVFQTMSWFNPLAHLAAATARLDQELACDEAVIGPRPEARRSYAETLLKAQLFAARSPLTCAFAGARHPLELRVSMLARPQPSLMRYMVGLCGIGGLTLLMSVAVWAISPESRAGLASVSSLHAVIARIVASG
jgi:beta-lactamase regulating signal transducer with metallopeptidase domain